MRYATLALAVLAVVFGIYFFDMGFRQYRGDAVWWDVTLWGPLEWLTLYGFFLAKIGLVATLSGLWGVFIHRLAGLHIGIAVGLVWGGMSIGIGTAWPFYVSFLLALAFSLVCTWIVLDAVRRLG